MKYAGTVTIVDDEGNIMHERELDTDEMIEELLNTERTFETQEEAEPEPEPPPAAPPARRAYNFKKHEGKIGCDECGSKGHRHKNGCPRIGTAKKDIPEDDEPKEEVYKGQEKAEMLSKEEFDMVMDSKENDLKFSSLRCADELSVDMREVNRAILTRTWDGYQQSYRTSST